MIVDQNHTSFYEMYAGEYMALFMPNGEKHYVKLHGHVYNARSRECANVDESSKKKI